MASTFINLCVSSLFAATTLAGTVAFAEAPDNVRVELSGLSCLANPGLASLDASGTKFTIEFDSFAASSDSLAASRSVCSLFVAVRAPRGWQYRVKTAKYNHDTILGRGGQRTTETAYYFQGQAQTVRLSTTMSGPIEAIGYTTVHNIPESDSVYSPCGAGRSLVLSPSARVNTSRDGSVEIHSSEIELEWKRCQ